MPARLYMTIGLPQSGKSSYCKKHFPECEHIDSKDIAQTLTIDAFKLICERIAASLAAGKNVVFESTNVQKKTRQMVIAALPENTAVTMLYFPVDTAICIERNHTNRLYSDKAIESLAEKFELPSVDEANNGLIIVC